MLNPKTFDDLAKRLSDAMPSGVKDLQQDMDKTLRAHLQSALGKLDLVTREEFDVQAKVLARTRAKVDTLEQQVRELEKYVLNGKTTEQDPNIDGD